MRCALNAREVILFYSRYLALLGFYSVTCTVCFKVTSAAYSVQCAESLFMYLFVRK